MLEEESILFPIHIYDETDAAALDRLTRNLLAEVKAAPVESAEIPRHEGPPPLNAKGDPVTVGAIAVAVLPSLLASLIVLIQHWLLRQQNQSIKIKLGENEIEIPRDATREELEPIIELLKSTTS